MSLSGKYCRRVTPEVRLPELFRLVPHSHTGATFSMVRSDGEDDDDVVFRFEEFGN